MRRRKFPRVALISFSLFLLFILIGTSALETSARPKRSGGRAVARGRDRSRKVARGAKLSRRERRQLARADRRGNLRMSKKEARAYRACQSSEHTVLITN